MKTRKVGVPYEIDGEVKSSFQRNEIVEFDSETETAKVVGTYTDYNIADKACDEFNRLAYDKEELLERQKKELREFNKKQEESYRALLTKDTYCKCPNCLK
jgi:hypothetical protein